MIDPSHETPKRVVIASANPLFGRGLQKLLTQRWGDSSTEIRLTGSMAETLEALESWQPELVVVDYDDRSMDRSEFLNAFVSGERPMQVMLVSLQASGAVVVYDRRTLSADQMEDMFFPAWPSAPKETKAIVSDFVPKRSSSMKHLAIVAVIVVVMTFLVNSLLNNLPLLPSEGSAQSLIIDSLFRQEFLVISFLFSLITVFIGYSVVMFRKRADGPDQGPNMRGSNKLEVAWTLLPLATVLYFSYIGSQNLAETRRVDPNAMVVNVTSGQWFWSFEYPDSGITSDELVVPVNQQILFRLTSQDVIHSFWVPEWRVKQDALPGENLIKELRVTPIETGEFTLRCAEMCGGAHAYMNAPVIVMEQEEFDAWVQDQSAAVASDPAARGQQIAKTNGCISCHSIDGSDTVGPTWKGLYGAHRDLAGGEEITVDDVYLHLSIVEPNAQIVEGYPPNIMPQNYEDQLSEEEIADIIAYIQSLE